MTLYPVPKPQPKRKTAPRRPKNRGRSAFPNQRDKAYTRWVRTENPCLLAGKMLRYSVSPRDAELEQGWLHYCFGPRDPAHVNQTVARGAPDFGQTVPLCRAAHDCFDQRRRFFFAATRLTQREMTSAAGGYALRFVERGGQPVTPKSKITRARPEETHP